jgi:hypothetical protein
MFLQKLVVVQLTRHVSSENRNSLKLFLARHLPFRPANSAPIFINFTPEAVILVLSIALIVHNSFPYIRTRRAMQIRIHVRVFVHKMASYLR